MLNFHSFNESQSLSNKSKNRDIIYFSDIFRKENNISIIDPDEIKEYLVIIEDEFDHIDIDINNTIKVKDLKLYHVASIEIVDEFYYKGGPDISVLLSEKKRQYDLLRVMDGAITRVSESLGMTFNMVVNREEHNGRSYVFEYTEDSSDLNSQFSQWFKKWNEDRLAELDSILEKVPEIDKVVDYIFDKFDRRGVLNPENYLSYSFIDNIVRVYGYPSNPNESNYILFDCDIMSFDKWESEFLELDDFVDFVVWTYPTSTTTVG